MNKVYTKSSLLIADDYVRIVVGGRGSYVEFSTEQIIKDNIVIPADQAFRLLDSNVYYDEYRTKDISNVKIYFQKRLVSYADYKVGMWYISVNDVKIENPLDVLFDN